MTDTELYVILGLAVAGACVYFFILKPRASSANNSSGFVDTANPGGPTADGTSKVWDGVSSLTPPNALVGPLTDAERINGQTLGGQKYGTSTSYTDNTGSVTTSIRSFGYNVSHINRSNTGSATQASNNMANRGTDQAAIAADNAARLAGEQARAAALAPPTPAYTRTPATGQLRSVSSGAISAINSALGQAPTAPLTQSRKPTLKLT